jgi:hypothetical protein
MIRGAKMVWKTFCMPVVEKGLGIKNLREWNKAAIMKPVLEFLTQKNSLWVKWVERILLKERYCDKFECLQTPHGFGGKLSKQESNT